MLAAFHGWGSHGWVGRLHFIAACWLRSGVNGLAGGMLSMGGGAGGRGLSDGEWLVVGRYYVPFRILLFYAG